MKITPRIVASLLLASFGASCTTTYDAYGRPVNSVDPGAAVGIAAAAGLVGYAIGNNNDDDDDYGWGNRGWHDYRYSGRYDRYDRYDRGRYDRGRGGWDGGHRGGGGRHGRGHGRHR